MFDIRFLQAARISKYLDSFLKTDAMFAEVQSLFHQTPHAQETQAWVRCLASEPLPILVLKHRHDHQGPEAIRPANAFSQHAFLNKAKRPIEMPCTCVVIKDVKPQPVSRKLLKGLVDDCSQDVSAKTLAGFRDDDAFQLKITVRRGETTKDDITSVAAPTFNDPVTAIGVRHLTLVGVGVVAPYQPERSKSGLQFEKEGKIINCGRPKIQG